MNDNRQGDEPVSLASVRDRAIGLLARREHGRVELRDKLRRRELPLDLIDVALDELAERNLQCDNRFAEAFVRSRISRGSGEIKIRAELRARGLDVNTIDLALEASDSDWKSNAEEALKKKFLTKISADNVRDARIRGKMQRFLQNRGYNSDQIISAVTRLTDFVAASSGQDTAQ